MNTIPETIPTAFAPETAFVLSLRPADGQETLQEKLSPEFAIQSPTYVNLERRGIPDSALND